MSVKFGLMTAEEFKKHPLLMNKYAAIGVHWWLADMSSVPHQAMYVNTSGKLVPLGANVSLEKGIAYRPTLRFISDVEYIPGEIFSYGLWEWIVIESVCGRVFAICKDYITFLPHTKHKSFSRSLTRSYGSSSLFVQPMIILVQSCNYNRHRRNFRRFCYGEN